MRDLPTYEQVSALLRHEDGILYWKVARGHRKAGAVAGTIDAKGYRMIGLFARVMLGHRIVWLLEYGEWPSGSLDHINGVRHDNRPSNLRICTLSQNQANRRPRSGYAYKGVTREKSGKWKAQIGNKGVGSYDSAEEAARAYDAAALETYGEFARINFQQETQR